MNQVENAPTPAEAIEPVELSPEQVAQLVEERAKREEEIAARLDLLGATLAKKRAEAIAGRQQLGIDDQWIEDIEFYEGIDDANRHEMTGGRSTAWRTKPPGQTMPRTEGEVRSTVFVNITRPYCDAAAARIGDMLMPTDDRSFSVGPTPVPELAEMAKGNLSLSIKKAMLAQVNTLPQELREGALMEMAANMVQRARMDVADAKERAQKAQDRIDDWFVECQYHGENRKVIEDAARIGTGVLKGPVPVNRKRHVVVNENGVMALQIKNDLSPASKRVDPFNLFPDPACGEDIHNGSFIWERDFITKRKLRELKGNPGYIDAQIDKCLEEGPQAASDAPEQQGAHNTESKDLYEIWYFYGVIEKADFEAAGCTCESEQVHAMMTMVNARVIKGAQNTLDTGEFPYDVMNWQRQSGIWAGIGVSRQIRTPQRMVNAGSRNLMDNAGLSAGPQILVRLKDITPADGDSTLRPRKVWYIDADSDITDVKQAFGVFNIDSRQVELMAIIQFGLKLAEDVTGMPLLLQGQQGKAPDTLGGMQMLNNNSSTVLRRLTKLHDDSITEPHVRRYYVWIMQYGEDAEKGDYQIDARGSSALVERDLQNQAVIQMGSIVLNPAFGINPKKWFREYCRSQRLDPKSFEYTDEEQKRIEEMAAQGPTDPRMAVAQLNNEFKERITLLSQQFEERENQRDRQLDYIIAKMEQGGEQTISLNELKTRLADTSIKIRAQRDLSAASNAVSLRKAGPAMKPPTEPAGRAPAGQAFQR